MDALTVIVADDHPVVRAGVSRLLKSHGIEVVAEASSGAELLGLLRRQDCSLLVTDLTMPGLGDIDLLKQVKAEHPDLPVLVLSMHPEERFAVRCFKAGASGYLSKESDPEEVVRAIKKIARGSRYVTPSLADLLLESLDVDYERPLHEQLSDREFQVLRLIATGLKNSEIADRLNLSEKTVSTYRTRILEKMGLKSNAELVRYALENGLVE